MDAGHCLGLALCLGDGLWGLAIAQLGDAAGLGQRHVCLHLAFLRQCPPPGMAGDSPGGDDTGGEYDALCGGLVDLAAIATHVIHQ